MLPFEIDVSGNVPTAVVLVLIAMTLINFGMAIFWIFVGWRAMRAHERVPDALRAALAPEKGSSPTYS
jgi:hypothetical protein